MNTKKLFSILWLVIVGILCGGTVSATEPKTVPLETAVQEIRQDNSRNLYNTVYTTKSGSTKVRVTITPSIGEGVMLETHLPEYDAVIIYDDPGRAPWRGAHWILFKHYVFIGKIYHTVPPEQLLEVLSKHIQLEDHSIRLRFSHQSVEVNTGTNGVIWNLFFRLEE